MSDRSTLPGPEPPRGALGFPVRGVGWKNADSHEGVVALLSSHDQRTKMAAKYEATCSAPVNIAVIKVRNAMK